MKCKLILITLMVFFIASICFSSDVSFQETSLWSITLSPFLNFPVGGSRDFFITSGGATISGEYTLPSKPLFSLRGEMAYDFFPLKVDNSLSLLSFGGGGGVNFPLAPRLMLKGHASTGFYNAFVNNKDTGSGSVRNIYISAKTGAFYLLFPSLSVGLTGSYDNYLNLYYGFGLSIGTTYYLPIGKKRRAEREEPGPARPTPLISEEQRERGKQIELMNLEFDTIFPVFFKYYDNHPVGRAVLSNCEETTISDINVYFFVKQYMDAPKKCISLEELRKGEDKEIELYALFTEKVLGVTEGTKVMAEISLDYMYRGKTCQKTQVETISLYDRNATMWDDDRKAAAFVTAKDPNVLRFAKNTVGMVKGKGSKEINSNLRTAMALYQALSLYGMSYVVDPTTPYTEFSQKKQVVDFLQFPRQTLEYKAGDCDDLSILYCALLESVGVETAFITVPGHIYMAFFTDLVPEEGRKAFLKSGDLIYLHEKTWIPVEVTSLDGGFLRAWEAGAKQWREASSHQKAGFYPMCDAWAIYQPVGLPGEGESLVLPKQDTLIASYTQELVTFIDREIYPQVEEIEREIQSTHDSPKSRNKLGVLYARYGLIERAEKEFEQSLVKDSSYVPALLNLGNISFLGKELDRALEYYERAFAVAPDNPRAVLCMARVQHELENYGMVKRAYNKLKTLDRDLARRFAYLDLRGDDAVRAAEFGKVKEVVLWEE